MLTPQRFTANTANKDLPASNTNAVVTKSAPGSGKRTAFTGIWWSYSGTPTGGRIVLTVGGNAIMDMDITAGGPGFFPTPIHKGGDDEAVVLTLYAGGSGITGKVGFFSAWTETAGTLP